MDARQGHKYLNGIHLASLGQQKKEIAKVRISSSTKRKKN
jgi:hypothetical protein